MKVLLIGSSFSALPMLSALRQRGAHVTVIGKHETDPGHAYSDMSIFEDYSDRETLLKVCRDNDFDYIVPSCNDYAYLAAAYVSAEMGFAGLDDLETTGILHSKDHFRRFCIGIGVPAPKILGTLTPETKTLPDDFEGAAIVKPVDSFSGRGIQIIHHASEISVASERAFAQSRRGTAVVEQFVEGTLHSHTAFVVSGCIIWHDFVDEFCDVYPYQVDRSSYPSQLTPDLRAHVHAAMEKLVSALGLCDGLLHTQFIASNTDFWIIECMRRCPGDLFGQHFKLALNYDYEAQYVASFIGSVPEAPNYLAETSSVERRVISTDKAQAFFGASMSTGAQNILYIPLKNSGEQLGPAPFDKAGIVFFHQGSASPEALEKSSSRVESYTDIVAPSTALQP